MRKYLLLTGVTGLVGRYLLRDLSRRGQRLAVLVRPSAKEQAAERIEALVQFWEAQLKAVLPRPVVLEGDVAERHLGLDVASRNWVADNCGRVMHNAATLTFHGKDRGGEPWRTNLGGTENVLECCRKCGISEMFYVSTAYVCGLREGTIRESELDCGQEFRNEYEESKFLAEQRVRKADFLRRLTVFRPAVIAGNAQTGYTSTYHGLYLYMQMMAVLNRHTEPDPDGRRHTPIRLKMTGDEPRNIVPVDWVSAVMCHLVATPSAWGHTYHLTPQERMTPRAMIEAGYKYFNSYGVEFCGAQTASIGDLNPLERAAYEHKSIYNEYEISDPEFDTADLRRQAPHLPCPMIDNAMLHRFWRFAEWDKWGRRRQPKPKVFAWAQDILPELAPQLVQQFKRANPHLFFRGLLGIEVTGPGGGQWHWKSQDHLNRQPGNGFLGLGLPADEAPVLRISIDRLQELAADALPSFDEAGQSDGVLTPVMD